MTRQRYTKEESANRIRNLLTGDIVTTSDTPETLQGPKMNFEEALSDIAELLGDSLPDEAISLPSALVATVAEANEPLSPVNTKIMTPASHFWAHEYGGIYTSTGTTAIAYTQNTWVKLTGTFKSYMYDSGSEILCDWNDDRIVVNETGVYFIDYGFSIWNYGAAGCDLKSSAFVDATEQFQTRSQLTLGASGTVHNLRGFGNAWVVSGTAVDLRLMVGTSNTLQINSAQLHIMKLPG